MCSIYGQRFRLVKSSQWNSSIPCGSTAFVSSHDHEVCSDRAARKNQWRYGFAWRRAGIPRSLQKFRCVVYSSANRERTNYRNSHDPNRFGRLQSFGFRQHHGKVLFGNVRSLARHLPNRQGILQPPQAGGLLALGSDVMLFLGAIVVVVPAFKAANQSPVLGYLFAGVIMGQLGLFRDVDDLERLSELGVLFLLFEMGLELSIDKLRSLAKYAFGLGSLQMALTTAAFMALSLPPGEGIMTKVLSSFFHAPSGLAKIDTVDEALVVAVALSLSSSAFVLQLLKERGELESKFGQATLGILLFQDIATVPFLVLLPLMAGGTDVNIDDISSFSLLMQLGPTALKTLGTIGLVLLGGRTLLRGVFETVAASRSDEAFFALCLLSVTGASVLTQQLGFSDTLGAFVSGVLLSETNFKAQVEADIQPFRGLLLGLFFVTTGASLDVGLLLKVWPTVLVLLVGLLSLKATFISAIGPTVGLTKAESLQTGFALSQGGEFAFVLLALAKELNVLPAELNKLLIIVVVLSMAATPLLTEAGRRVADIASAVDGEELSRSSEGFNIDNPVLICGFGDVGQTVANMLDAIDTPWVAFDLTVARVQAAQDAGFNVLYGDGTRPKVLHAAGIESPCAIVIGYSARQRAVAAVESLRTAFPSIPIVVRGIDIKHSAELQHAGATHVVCSETEAGLAVGSKVAECLGAREGAVATIEDALRIAILHRRDEIMDDMLKSSNRKGRAPDSKESAIKQKSSKTFAGKEPQTESPSYKVFKFDSSRIDVDSLNLWGRPLEDGNIDQSEDGTGGILANIGSTLLGAMGGSKEEDAMGEINEEGNGKSKQLKVNSKEKKPSNEDVRLRDEVHNQNFEDPSVQKWQKRNSKESKEKIERGLENLKIDSSNSENRIDKEMGEEEEVKIFCKNTGKELALPDGSSQCPVTWDESQNSCSGD